jgi:hypothetical protein
LDDHTSIVALVLWALVLCATALAILPARSSAWIAVRDRIPTPIALSSRILVGAVAAFFAACLLLRSSPVRTTAFVAVPLAVAGLASAGSLIRSVRLPAGRNALLAGFGAVALVVGIGAWTATASFSYTPVENWKGAADFINRTFPAGTSVVDARFLDCWVCGSPEKLSSLSGYLDDAHPVAAGLDEQAFAEGRQAVVSWVTSGEVDPTDARLAQIASTVVEEDVPQQRGTAPLHAIRVLYVSPPND